MGKERVFIAEASGNWHKKAPDGRLPGRLYRAVGVDADGTQRLLELPADEEARIRAEWAADDAIRAAAPAPAPSKSDRERIADLEAMVAALAVRAGQAKA